MIRGRFDIATTMLCAFAFATNVAAQTNGFEPVTRDQLANPPAGDWLMINRTYDEQRFSPLDQVNKGNVGQLKMAWTRGLAAGTSETTPIVAQGVMYVVSPGAGVLAINAINGDQIWEYWRELPKDMAAIIGDAQRARTKGLAIFEDLVFYDAPDGFIVALDAKTGKVRWETKVHDYKDQTQSTSAPIVADSKVITGRTCEKRVGCFIAAHDAKTGKELWKFYNTPAPGEPGGDSWGNIPVDGRIASSWGLPGSYDPTRKVLYWAISNPKPWTRWKRHGNIDAVPRAAPSELYSNSTVAIDVETGKLVWYYQHLPGDDWDLDHIHERTLVRTRINPDPAAVKWINPNIPRGQERDVVVEVAEAGGIWVLDRQTGQFLWATPFPLDVPDFHISRIDVDTGRTHINWDKVKKKDGDRVLVCFHNTRSFWATAYHPGKNSLYIPLSRCLSRHDRELREPGRLRPSPPGHASGIRSAEIRLHRQSESRDRQGRRDPFATGPRQRLGAGDRGRPGVLGRHGSPLPRLRRRYRKGSVGDRARRHHLDQHHYLHGERTPVCGGDDRRCAVGHGRPARRGQEFQAGARPQRDLRLRIARGAMNDWRPSLSLLVRRGEGRNLYDDHTFVRHRSLARAVAGGEQSIANEPIERA